MAARSNKPSWWRLRASRSQFDDIVERMATMTEREVTLNKIRDKIRALGGRNVRLADIVEFIIKRYAKRKKQAPSSLNEAVMLDVLTGSDELPLASTEEAEQVLQDLKELEYILDELPPGTAVSQVLSEEGDLPDEQVG